MKTLYNALIRVSRDPVAADRAVLSDLYRRWRDEHLPALPATGRRRRGRSFAPRPRTGWRSWSPRLRQEAGQYLWFLAIVGGSAWKMEASLTRFCRQHLADVLDRHGRGAGAAARTARHPTGPAVGTRCKASTGTTRSPPNYPRIATRLAGRRRRHRQLAADRRPPRRPAGRPSPPGRRAEFEALLRVTQRYAVIREEQSRDLTLGWPVLRACAARLGEHLVARRILADADDVYFCTRDEIDAPWPARRRHSMTHPPPGACTWEQHRRLPAPVTLGRPTAADRRRDRQAPCRKPAHRAARSRARSSGIPASAGRATGPVRIVHGPHDFAAFRDGDVLVAKATAPAWTPLFARAAAVVTDGGTLAAHASLVAREYGIPAVVGTGDATSRLHSGQLVTVDGTAGTVTPAATAERSDVQP